jgi:hypothetical protein
MNLDDHLAIFNGAQTDLFNFLGISRKLENYKTTEKAGVRIHFNHGGGNINIPTPWPQVLDYRGRPWQTARRDGRQPGDDVILIRADESGSWEAENVVRFNIMSWWTPAFDATLTVAAVTHLPKAEELYYAQPDKVPLVEAGGMAFGDVCILILRDSDRG